MKKHTVLFLFLLLVTSIANAQAQSNAKMFNLGIGVQYTNPFTSLSVKYALGKNSILQATASPFGVDKYNRTYYGLRYQYVYLNHILAHSKNSNITDYAFAFLGVGTLNRRYRTAFYGYNSSNEYVLLANPATTEYNLSYTLGTGYEAIFHTGIGKVGAGAEIYYGLYNNLDVYTLNAGASVHYYFNNERARNRSSN
ncbi:MAG: hypothetical protein EBX41_08630 [Chitinophagia bacterium]|nr:hypothetical protein [Chitinophagia bacterium]